MACRSHNVILGWQNAQHAEWCEAHYGGNGAPAVEAAGDDLRLCEGPSSAVCSAHYAWHWLQKPKRRTALLRRAE
jgi:hypothetical protein